MDDAGTETGNIYCADLICNNCILIQWLWHFSYTLPHV